MLLKVLDRAVLAAVRAVRRRRRGALHGPPPQLLSDEHRVPAYDDDGEEGPRRGVLQRRPRAARALAAAAAGGILLGGGGFLAAEAEQHRQAEEAYRQLFQERDTLEARYSAAHEAELRERGLLEPHSGVGVAWKAMQDHPSRDPETHELRKQLDQVQEELDALDQNHE